MTSKFYLPRTLQSEYKTYNEASLWAASRFLVVLAEPGAGKTRLMESLAQQLGTQIITANRFANTDTSTKGFPLLIDAYDELAKVDASGLYKLLAAAQKASPTHLAISSRSSEWDNAANSAFQEFFGEPPLVARLAEFTENEQRRIFENHSPTEDFAAFHAEVSRFNLQVLLPNPQFLRLFADAYVESGRKFTDKKSIFSLALERLAKETNSTIRNFGGSLSAAQRVDATSEIFAKLLLSGAEGVTISEASEDPIYPLLSSLAPNMASIKTILATRLFKPGDSIDTHRPAHKIISEYAAANYLTKRIGDPADTISIEKCLSVIAPNSTVRDELRGLLGWMASLGNKSVQKAAIDLDPYAVLANGDPSQLDAASKKLLIDRLKDIERKDPYFRRGDFWRRFSVANFFTSEVIDEIRPLLTQAADGHLRDLVLELLSGSPAIKHLTDELRELALSPQEGEHERLMALNCLLDQGSAYDHLGDMAILIVEASQTSLELVAKAIERCGVIAFSDQYLLDYLRTCAHLYPSHNENYERKIGSRYFLKRLIGQINLSTTEFLLNGLTNGLTCTCAKKNFECNCRNGISKIAGSLLDRFFMLSSPPYDPKQVWQWVRNLNFHHNILPDQSKAVEALQSNRELRQGIIKHVFGELTDKNDIRETKIHHFDWHSHSGLVFQREDYEFIADHAFEIDNVELWTAFIARHQAHRDKAQQGPDLIRRHMREQAAAKPAFMRAWIKSNRDDVKLNRQLRIPRFRRSRRLKSRDKRTDEIRAANIKYLHDNRELVESGRHWGCLVSFSELILRQPEKIEEEFAIESIVRNGLCNCLNFIAPKVPSLLELAQLNCASQHQQSETILYAACLEIFRRDGNLNCVPVELLLALRTNLDMHYSAVKVDDRNALEAEVHRLAFSTDEEAESFLRNYIEPQLRDPKCKHPQVHWLRHDSVFKPLAPKLAYEWLCTLDLMPVSALDILFEIAVQYLDRERLEELIAYRSSEITSEAQEERRAFWFMRAIYFLKGNNAPHWDWLISDKDNILLLNERSGSMNRSDNPKWPRLTSDKVEVILRAFLPHWPKVPLPSSWGTGSPKEETAYRFLTEVIWVMNADEPDRAIPVIKSLLSNNLYADLHREMRSMLSGLTRQKALINFRPPNPQEIVEMLDQDAVITVEGLRQLVLHELSRLQSAIDGGEFNTAERFYAGTTRLDEEPCTRLIAERLSLILEPKSITITPEHHLKHDKRCDFTATKLLAGKRRLLVTEVKGQWHPKLYEAASNQLSNLYAIHPDAEQQGIYLVIWFGANEMVAGLKGHGISNAKELKDRLENALPDKLRGLIDVFVLDVSNRK